MYQSGWRKVYYHAFINYSRSFILLYLLYTMHSTPVLDSSGADFGMVLCFGTKFNTFWCNLMPMFDWQSMHVKAYKVFFFLASAVVAAAAAILVSNSRQVAIHFASFRHLDTSHFSCNNTLGAVKMLRQILLWHLCVFLSFYFLS